MSHLKTRLTQMMGLDCPVVSAPMAFAGGGALAAAVSDAGGLGLIGAGYGDKEWIDEQFALAQGHAFGVGFITWALQQNPSLLTHALTRQPKAVMLSFGDPRPFARQIRAAGSALICQCQTIAHVTDALEAGADIIVAQGGEAGGHGATRGTLSFVPEVADYLAQNAPDTLLLAAGGIADGRGLAAALVLGADGALIGTRLWATTEALVHPSHHQAIINTGGDGTIRTDVADVARQIDWPKGFSARIKRNAFTEKWHGRSGELQAKIETEAPKYAAAFAAGDPENTGVWFGEAAGLINDISPAAKVIREISEQAHGLLHGPDRNPQGGRLS